MSVGSVRPHWTMGSFDYGGDPPHTKEAEHGVLQAELHWGRLIAHFDPSGVHVWSPALALPGLHGDASVQEDSSWKVDEARRTQWILTMTYSVRSRYPYFVKKKGLRMSNTPYHGPE